MAAAQPVAVEKRALDSVAATIVVNGIAKGRKNPQTTTLSPGHGLYNSGDSITIICQTDENTTPIAGDA
jgi:hypothetical protein